MIEELGLGEYDEELLIKMEIVLDLTTTGVSVTKLVVSLGNRSVCVDTDTIAAVQFTLAIFLLSQQYVRLCWHSIISSSDPEH